VIFQHLSQITPQFFPKLPSPPRHIPWPPPEVWVTVAIKIARDGDGQEEATTKNRGNWRGENTEEREAPTETQNRSFSRGNRGETEGTSRTRTNEQKGEKAASADRTEQQRGNRERRQRTETTDRTNSKQRY